MTKMDFYKHYWQVVVFAHDCILWFRRFTVKLSTEKRMSNNGRKNKFTVLNKIVARSHFIQSASLSRFLFSTFACYTETTWKISWTTVFQWQLFPLCFWLLVVQCDDKTGLWTLKRVQIDTNWSQIVICDLFLFDKDEKIIKVKCLVKFFFYIEAKFGQLNFMFIFGDFSAPLFESTICSHFTTLSTRQANEGVPTLNCLS